MLVGLGLLEQVKQTLQDPEDAVRGRSARRPPLAGTGWSAGCAREFDVDARDGKRISLTRLLNDSGMPASMACSPLTMFS